MAYDVAQLLAMSQTAARRPVPRQPGGRHPERRGRGHGDHRAGHDVSAMTIAELINHFGWQGKVFDAKKGVLKNRILAFGLEAIIAKVYKAPSWLDDKECIVLDYSETSLVAHWIRDEIRLIGPGFYLGKVYWDKDRLIDFCLQF